MSCKNPKCKCLDDPSWKVDAPEFGNCFFEYMKHNPRPHTLQEISNLLGLSISAVATVEKKALSKLKRKLLRNNINIDTCKMSRHLS